jgi:hypothetical protein
VAHGEQAREAGERLLEHDLHGVGIHRGEARHRLRAPVTKLGAPLDDGEGVRGSGFHAGIENARQREHDVVGRHLAPVVELDALAQRERPRQPVAGGAPELRERGRDGERLIEAHEAVEDLLDDGDPVDVGDARRVQADGLVAERTAVRAGRLAPWRRGSGLGRRETGRR